MPWLSGDRPGSLRRWQPLRADGDGLPEVTLRLAEGTDGVPLVDALVAAGLSASKGAARRLIRESGARLDGQPVTDEAATLTAPAVLSAGRKRHVRLILTP